jgi:hypothetical protein
MVLVTERALYDLVKEEAAARRLPPIDVWRMALLAVEQDVLRPRFGVQVDPLRHGTTWPTAIYGARQAAERGQIPDYQWTKSVFLDADAFNRWLDAAIGIPDRPANRLPRRRPSSNEVDREVRRYLDNEQRSGRTPSTKRMWNWVKRELPEATHAQAQESMKRIEGGDRGPGRPRNPVC